jgi:hypothetical protein
MASTPRSPASCVDPPPRDDYYPALDLSRNPHESGRELRITVTLPDRHRATHTPTLVSVLRLRPAGIRASTEICEAETSTTVGYGTELLGIIDEAWRGAEPESGSDAAS